MRKMFSKNQIKDIIQKAINSGDIDTATSLIGKYVRIMEAPSSTTLNDEQIEQILEGCFIEGTFLSLINPVFLPVGGETENVYYGLILHGSGTSAYYITKSTKAITKYPNTTGRWELSNISNVNGKSIPSYPANTGTFTLKCVDGVLTWVEDE